MFRALTCPSSGGTTEQTQHLLSTGVVYSRLGGRGYQMLCLCSCSSWGWACQGPKHVEDSSMTYMFILKCALKLGEEIILLSYLSVLLSHGGNGTWRCIFKKRVLFVTECHKQIEWMGNCPRFWYEYLFNGWNGHCIVKFSCLRREILLDEIYVERMLY